MKGRQIVFAQHGDHKVYIHEMPCGVLTYNKKRKRHEWVVVVPGTLFQINCGEDYAGACREAARLGGHATLRLDGVPVGFSKEKR